ncbi:MAG TPA: DUF4233 domain-containing protein [Trebonia sp.]|jgi:hypothetical protein|nr:DUF4233 domain-containing protein [Trebonia sp.]
MKRLCGTVLAMEATLVALCIVPAIALEHVSGAVAGGVGGGIAIAAILLSGFIGKRRWALYAGSVLQLVVIAAGVVLPVMYVLGVIFAALWFGGIRLARKWESAAAASAPFSEG